MPLILKIYRDSIQENNEVNVLCLSPLNRQISRENIQMNSLFLRKISLLTFPDGETKYSIHQHVRDMLRELHIFHTINPRELQLLFVVL